MRNTLIVLFAGVAVLGAVFTGVVSLAVLSGYTLPGQEPRHDELEALTPEIGAAAAEAADDAGYDDVLDTTDQFDDDLDALGRKK